MRTTLWLVLALALTTLTVGGTAAEESHILNLLADVEAGDTVHQLVDKQVQMEMLRDDIPDSYYAHLYGNRKGKIDVLRGFPQLKLSRKKRTTCGVKSRFTRRQKLTMFRDTRSIRRSLGGANVTPKYKWSNDMARRAQQWANECSWSHGMVTSCGGTEMAQNLMMIRTGQRWNRVKMKTVARKWFKGKKLSSKCSERRQVGPRTDVALSSTSWIGCGIKQCRTVTDPDTGKSWKNAIMVACNFDRKKTMLPQALVCTCAVLAAAQVDAMKTAAAGNNNACAELVCCAPECPETRQTTTHFQQNGRRCPGCPNCRDMFPTKTEPCGSMSCCPLACGKQHQVKTYYFQSGRRCEGCSYCRAHGKADKAEAPQDTPKPKGPPALPPPTMNFCPSVSCGNMDKYLTCPPEFRRPRVIAKAPDGSDCYGCDECIAGSELPLGCPRIECGPLEAHLTCPESERQKDMFPIMGVWCPGCMTCLKTPVF